MAHVWHVHPPVDSPLSCLRLLAAVAVAAVSAAGQHLSGSLLADLSSKYPEVKLLPHTVVLFLIF